MNAFLMDEKCSETSGFWPEEVRRLLDRFATVQKKKKSICKTFAFNSVARKSKFIHSDFNFFSAIFVFDFVVRIFDMKTTRREESSCFF